MNESLAESISRCQAQIDVLTEKIRNDIVATAGINTLAGFSDSIESFGIKSIDQNGYKVRRNLKGHFGKIYAVAWSPAVGDENSLVSASQDGKLIIWDGDSSHKKNLIGLKSAWVMCVAFSNDGQTIASGGLDNICSIYKINNNSNDNNNSNSMDPYPFCELAKHEGYLSSCKFISNDRIATASGDSSIVLWDIVKSTPLHSLLGHDNDVMSISCSSSGNMIISGSCDCSCKAWDLRSGECVQTFFGHESDVNHVSLFPDDFAFASASDDTTCRLFDTRTWSEVNHYYDKLLCAVTACSFTGSGRILVAGYDDFTMHVWDTIKGTQISPTLQQHEARVGCLEVNKPGSAIATGAWDASLKIWA